MNTHDIGALDDFVSGEARQIRVEKKVLAVIRIEDSVYVLSDRCSHEDFSLALGDVDPEKCEIECARHGAMFSLKTGEPMSFPATKPVATYEVKVINGRVEVSL